MESNELKKIGLIGGSFDPIHLGHLIVARDAAEKLSLSEVVFIPADTPPHKLTNQRVASEHRLAMLRLATERDPIFSVSDVEIVRGGISFTYDTVREFAASSPEAEFTMIIGGDTLVDLHNWHKIDAVLELCDVATFVRPGNSKLTQMARKIELEPGKKEQLISNVFDARMMDVSSTEIRARIAAGLSISYLVPPEVERYIFKHELYKK